MMLNCNRTYVELKFDLDEEVEVEEQDCNRTYVELKSVPYVYYTNLKAL